MDRPGVRVPNTPEQAFLAAILWELEQIHALLAGQVIEAGPATPESASVLKPRGGRKRKDTK
jgi:hypothetical protein